MESNVKRLLIRALIDLEAYNNFSVIVIDQKGKKVECDKISTIEKTCDSSSLINIDCTTLHLSKGGKIVIERFDLPDVKFNSVM